jgi:hypothetical protein
MTRAQRLKLKQHAMKGRWLRKRDPRGGDRRPKLCTYTDVRKYAWVLSALGRDAREIQRAVNRVFFTLYSVEAVERWIAAGRPIEENPPKQRVFKRVS